jgi:hypothetical protein
MKDTLDSIKNNNMIFITAQPDIPYFHWQVSLYLYQFNKHHIIDYCYAVFGYENNEPSDYVKNMMSSNKNIITYKDTRSSETKRYSPSIRPHLLSKFFKDNPELGKNVFYHDSDIFLVKLPKFELMLNNNIAYLSDTISYIGYDYLKDCGTRYKEKHNVSELDLLNNMCRIINIHPDLVKKNQNNSGGAQYLFKNIEYTYWDECENLSIKLYDFFCEYEKKYPIVHHVQKWCAGMWVELWNYWRRGGYTKIHKELDFSWATGTVADYNSLNIFHLAGVTNDNKHDKFHKGMYTKQLVFDSYIKDNTIFNHISNNNATYEYCKIIKEYIIYKYIPSKKTKNNIYISILVLLAIILLYVYYKYYKSNN